MPKTKGTQAKKTKKASGKVKGSGFSIEHMDRTKDPLNEFYLFANGKWVKSNPVPSDKTSWGSFNELRETNDNALLGILEKVSSKKPVDKVTKLLFDLYRSAMDTKTLEKLKFKPVEPLMKRIDSVESKKDLHKCIAYLHSHGIPSFFVAFSRGDQKKSDIYSFYIRQGGLSLPNRDYYLEENFAKMKEAYEKHVQNMFFLYLGDRKKAGKYAASVLDIETKLAKYSRKQADLRDVEKNYNQVKTRDLDKEFPEFKPVKYLSELSVPKADYIVVGQPEFLKSAGKLVDKLKLDDIKTYMKWCVLNFSAPYLHSAAEDEHFDFFNRKLTGQKEPEPRGKRAVHVIDKLAGEALGSLYVKQYFGKDAAKRMETMVNDIRAVFLDRLKELPWMSPATRKRAVEKFNKFRPKIGHPKKFRDYSSIKTDPAKYFDNVLSATHFEANRLVKRVGKKVNRDEWLMTPPTVNAYFSPTDNEIVFPAGILQPPFFDVTKDDAVNYGGIGGVISHEITHGYDDQGSQYDSDGNIKNWWSKEDRKEFTKRADAVVDLYSSFEIFPGHSVQGKLTLGENIADFGGVSIAYEALQRRLKANPKLKKNIDGLTPEQRFYLSWAQIWRGNVTPDEKKRRLAIDPHSPNELRATLPVINHSDFEKVFKGNDKAKGNKKRAKITIW